MNDNQPNDLRTSPQWLRSPGMIIGRIGPGDEVIFDDPNMLEKLRRAAAAAKRRSELRLVEQ
jgi:hypothetical protein